MLRHTLASLLLLAPFVANAAAPEINESSVLEVAAQTGYVSRLATKCGLPEKELDAGTKGMAKALAAGVAAAGTDKEKVGLALALGAQEADKQYAAKPPVQACKTIRDALTKMAATAN